MNHVITPSCPLSGRSFPVQLAPVTDADGSARTRTRMCARRRWQPSSGCAERAPTDRAPTDRARLVAECTRGRRRRKHVSGTRRARLSYVVLGDQTVIQPPCSNACLGWRGE